MTNKEYSTIFGEFALALLLVQVVGEREREREREAEVGKERTQKAMSFGSHYSSNKNTGIL